MPSRTSAVSLSNFISAKLRKIRIKLTFVKANIKPMKVLITGTSQGIGKAIAERFIIKGHDVIGVDRSESSISAENYTHVTADVRDIDKMPEITGVEILINNAGTQNEDDIDINLKSLIRFTEKYGLQKDIRSILYI